MSLRLEGIAKAFKGAAALADISLEVPRGETLAVIGPSGTGKTVLLRLIAGALEPDAGRIFINGRDMTDVAPEDREVGMAFQNFALFPHMDARANIASPLAARGLSLSETERRVKEIASLLKIDHVLDHKPKELSNGQKQRAALGRALASEPSILLLDDPLRNIDARLRFEMRLELPQLLKARQASTIHVTQDYREAMALGDRIAVMDGVGVAQIGRPEEIWHEPATISVARLFGDPAINLLDVVPVTGSAGPAMRLAGAELPLGPDRADAVGRDCVLGIRPEAFRFAAPGEIGALPVRVLAETPLNEKAVTLVADDDGREILVSRPANAPGPGGSEAHVAPDMSASLLFDRETGARMPRPQDAPTTRRNAR